MTIEEAKEAILKLNDEGHPFGYVSTLRKRFPEAYRLVLSNTAELDKYKPEFVERIYCFLNGLKDRPLCRVCGKKPVKRFLNGSLCDVRSAKYSDWCSIKCFANDPEVISQKKATLFAKHGSATYNNLEKAKKTREEKYGGWTSPDYVAKCKRTKLERYGDEKYVNVRKIKQTKLERYGDENYANVEAAKLTKLARYGDENYNNGKKISETKLNFSDEKDAAINEKRRKTNVERNGYEYYLQTDDGKKHYRDLYREKTGFDSPLCTNAPGRLKGDATRIKKYGNYNNREKISDTTRRNYYNSVLANNSSVKPLFSIEEYAEPHYKYERFKWKCKKCGSVFDSKIYYGNSSEIVARCPICYPIEGHSASIGEKEMVRFIKSVYCGEVRENDRREIWPLEIDAFLPDLKIGFEYNGAYWHSDLFKPDPRYHLEKTKKCESKGIRLYQIFENEWNKNRAAVERVLKSIVCRKTVCGSAIEKIDQAEFEKLLLENTERKTLNGLARFKVSSDFGEVVSFGSFAEAEDKDGHFVKVKLFPVGNAIVDLNDDAFKVSLRSFIANEVEINQNDRILINFDRRFFSALDYNLCAEDKPKRIVACGYVTHDCGSFYVDVSNE